MDKKIAFVTNFCQHYRVKTFELLSKRCNVDFYFYSKGEEKYWLPEHGIRIGDFDYNYLNSFNILNINFSFSLIKNLVFNDYDIYLSGVVGKFSLPITFLISRIKRKPFILWTGIWTRIKTKTHTLLFPFLKCIYRKSDAIVVYGNHVKAYLLSEGILEEKIFIAPHAVDNSSYSYVIAKNIKRKLKDDLKITDNDKVILFLGRFVETKGLDYLLEAFSKIKTEGKLILVGEGPIKNDLKDLSVSLGISNRVYFHDYVTPEDTIAYYSIADVFVLPSISVKEGKETWGLVVNEAFNQGVPVIATYAVGAAAGGLIENGVNGYVVPERDSYALAFALDKLLLSESDLKLFGQNARNKIQHWNNDLMVNNFLSAINHVQD